MVGRRAYLEHSKKSEYEERPIGPTKRNMSESVTQILLQSESESTIIHKKEKGIPIGCLIVPLLVFLTVGVVFFFILQLNVFDDRKDVVILISVDGFRHKYLTSGDFDEYIPNIRSLINNATFSKTLKPSFPTKTFPNHYTIVTGLLPAYHGIVGNHFYDPESNEEYTMASTDSKWWGGEPIWNTVKKANMKSASVFWVGSDKEIGGLRPDYYLTYNGSLPYSERVATAVGWLNQSYSKIPSVLTLYFEGVDSAGHKYGPDDIQQIGNALQDVDTALGELFTMLELLDGKVDPHIMLVSDHGMTELSSDRVIALGEYLENDCVKAKTFATSLARIYTTSEDCTQVIYDQLQGIEHISVYKREEIPQEYKYDSNPKIGDIFVLSEIGWEVVNSTSSGSLGGHGYDNNHEDMQSIFIAKGNRFKDNEEESIHNTEIYNLICKILDITSAPNNGTYPSIDLIHESNFF
eukprot:TRINITY_DN1222_c0_g1_i2.p1 TRINITY_DN1222_c0_g1~~TRINITY_DN1222_c0_g1_i2.p1  ORF type:complete len:465 (+),score=91.40 TRINITY_DN1222_c0_g1_i2:86-1480(+)